MRSLWGEEFKTGFHIHPSFPPWNKVVLCSLIIGALQGPMQRSLPTACYRSHFSGYSRDLYMVGPSSMQSMCPADGNERIVDTASEWRTFLNANVT